MIDDVVQEWVFQEQMEEAQRMCSRERLREFNRGQIQDRERGREKKRDKPICS